MTDREIEIKDILIQDAMISSLQTKLINATKVSSKNSTLLSIVSDIIDKDLKIEFGEKFIYELSLKNILIEHTSLLNEKKDNLQESFEFTVFIFDDTFSKKLTKNKMPSAWHRTYETSFDRDAVNDENSCLALCRQIKIHALGQEFSNTAHLLAVRDLRIVNMKVEIYEAIMSLKEIVYG